MSNETDVIEALSSRSELYRMLAQLFFRPLTQEQIDALAGIDLAKLAADKESPFSTGYNDLYRYLRRSNTGTREELASDFTTAFYGVVTYEGRTAEPYESLYQCGNGLLMGEPRGEVYRTFKRSCIKVREGLDLPDDHLSFILEYMAFLCDELEKCIKRQDYKEALDLVGQQQEFFQEHIASWYARFYALSSKLLKTRFYKGCMELTRAFVAIEPDQLEELEEMVRELAEQTGKQRG